MLARKDLWELAQLDKDNLIYQHYINAVNIRLGFQGVQYPWYPEGKLVTPSCHDVAHAYAIAFDVEAVDGECAHFRGPFDAPDGTLGVDVSTYMHSWCRVRVADGVAAILDIYPDVGMPMMPIILRDPHPGYWEPHDEEFEEQVRANLKGPHFENAVQILACEFLRLTHEKT